MDIAILINEYLKDKHELRTEDDCVNIVEGSIARWDFANIPCPTQEELEALAPVVDSKLEQEKTNVEALKFLAETDYKVLKYRDQVDMGITPDMSLAEYQELLVKRQAARAAIIR